MKPYSFVNTIFFDFPPLDATEMIVPGGDVAPVSGASEIFEKPVNCSDAVFTQKIESKKGDGRESRNQKMVCLKVKAGDRKRLIQKIDEKIIGRGGKHTGKSLLILQ